MVATYRSSSSSYPTKPSATPYDVPFSHSTCITDNRRQTNRLVSMVGHKIKANLTKSHAKFTMPNSQKKFTVILHMFIYVSLETHYSLLNHQSLSWSTIMTTTTTITTSTTATAAAIATTITTAECLLTLRTCP